VAAAAAAAAATPAAAISAVFERGKELLTVTVTVTVIVTVIMRDRYKHIENTFCNDAHLHLYLCSESEGDPSGPCLVLPPVQSPLDPQRQRGHTHLTVTVVQTCSSTQELHTTRAGVFLSNTTSVFSPPMVMPSCMKLRMHVINV
jgi:hypothetical protein